ncbi:MAG: hypothetical protein R6X06_04965 [Gammaproteobacteria bacterium]
MKSIIAGLLFLFAAGGVVAETLHKPFIQATAIDGDVAQVVTTVKQKLTDAGFEVVGEVSPYADTTIVVITNDALKANAALTEYGVFGAAQRVTVTSAATGIQVGYTNPVYMAHAYRMEQDLADVAAALGSALGHQGEYGPEKGLSAEALRKYHYKFLMPYFYNRLHLASHKSYEAAIATLEKNLAARAGGVAKVYRVDLPGMEKTVIGVHMSGPENNDCSGDQYIMSRIDFKEVKSSGHLPYEIVVSGKNIYALPAEFRIAISFPDLSMMGSNSFASIMCAPNAIEEALTAAAGGKM